MLVTQMQESAPGDFGDRLADAARRTFADLRRITGPEPVCRGEIWPLGHPDLRSVRRIAVFADWLVASIGSDGSLLDGSPPPP